MNLPSASPYALLQLDYYDIIADVKSTNSKVGPDFGAKPLEPAVPECTSID